MNETTPFWQELSSTLMLHGSEWQEIVRSLPDHINAVEAQGMLQSWEQLALCKMQGVAFLAGSPVCAAPDPDVLLKFLRPNFMSIEVAILQWLYQFLILEGIAKHQDQTPLAEWHPMFLDMYARGLHFMVYMAALICIMGEKDSDIYAPNIVETEEDVRNRIRLATENLHRKAQDYGESFRRHGVVGLLPRLWDKAARYATLRSEISRNPNFESLYDSASDLLGYSLIAWSLVLEVPAANNVKKTAMEIQ